MPQTIVVLRHAEAGDKRAWSADDGSRPLDEVGLAQSAALPDTLASWPVEEILTSPTARCRHTVVGLAAVRRVPVTDVDWLALGGSVASGARALLDASADPGRSVLLCTHGEVLAELLVTLAGAAAPDDPMLRKGAAWVVRYDATGAPVEVVHVPAPVAVVDQYVAL